MRQMEMARKRRDAHHEQGHENPETARRAQANAN
jgi:hypothetical protein